MATPMIDSSNPLGELQNSYAALPRAFHARVEPTPVAEPHLLRLNRPLAETLGLNPGALASATGTAVLAGNRVPPDAEPIAMAYAGHQFGNFVPSLGDGRAVLLGEIVDRSGKRRDIQLKGAGRTPFSRMGDGRAALGPVMREYIVSEAMAALGVATTRALAMVATGEPVYRETALPGAVLARVARGHVRVGTFEYFYRRGDHEAVRRLADYVIQRHYPHVGGAANPYRALLDEVVAGQAELIAQWLLVGFIHGVMNTDNMAITGETIDYGPCAFMDAYDPNTVYSSIDRSGRYAYGQQPRVGHWNLAQLAQCLLPLLGDDEKAAMQSAREALDTYPVRFETRYRDGLRAKLGLEQDCNEDMDLARSLLSCMAEQEADFTNTFRLLAGVKSSNADNDTPVRRLFREPEAFDRWAGQYRQRLARETRGDAERRTAMRRTNPAYVPRNHRIEQAIQAATDDNDFRPMDELLTVLASPFEDHPDLAHYTRPPEPHEVVRQTFCGT